MPDSTRREPRQAADRRPPGSKNVLLRKRALSRVSGLERKGLGVCRAAPGEIPGPAQRRPARLAGQALPHSSRMSQPPLLGLKYCQSAYVNRAKYASFILDCSSHTSELLDPRLRLSATSQFLSEPPDLRDATTCPRRALKNCWSAPYRSPAVIAACMRYAAGSHHISSGPRPQSMI